MKPGPSFLQDVLALRGSPGSCAEAAQIGTSLSAHFLGIQSSQSRLTSPFFSPCGPFTMEDQESGPGDVGCASQLSIL